MASETPEAQEAGSENKQKQEEGEQEEEGAQENEAAAKRGFSDPPAVLLLEDLMEKYHLLWLADYGHIHPLNDRPVAAKKGWVIGSVEGGWLIHYRHLAPLKIVVPGYHDKVLCYNYICLANPVSGDEHSLPPETCFITRRSFKLRFVAEVITTNCSPDSSEFFVVAFFLNAGVHWLALCRIGDESWTRIADVKHMEIRDNSIVIQPALALDDKNKLLYFLHLNPSNTNYDLMVFDLKDSNNIKMKRLVMAAADNLPTEGTFCPQMKRNDGYITNLNIGDRILYLVVDSSCGDLFLVLQGNEVEGDSSILPIDSYSVYIKLDEGDPQWKEIDDLGDRSIFISRYRSRLISTAELNAGSKSVKEFIKGNCVYFALHNRYETEAISSRRHIGMFSLTDGKINNFCLPPLFLKNPIITIWFDTGST